MAEAGRRPEPGTRPAGDEGLRGGVRHLRVGRVVDDEAGEVRPYREQDVIEGVQGDPDPFLHDLAHPRDELGREARETGDQLDGVGVGGGRSEEHEPLRAQTGGEGQQRPEAARRVGDHGAQGSEALADRGDRGAVAAGARLRAGRVAVFAPRPVVYRTTDFRTNEFRGLIGGAKYEPAEENPMIGYRGCYRYIREPELFALELEILARVREETPNLHLMIPFVRTRWELEACLEAIAASPLGRQRGLHRWVMAEVPSIAHRIAEYAALGVDGVSIGSNDLTQLVLGVDRDSEVCAELFDEADPAVMATIRDIVTACREAGSGARELTAQSPGSPLVASARQRRRSPLQQGAGGSAPGPSPLFATGPSSDPRQQ